MDCFRDWLGGIEYELMAGQTDMPVEEVVIDSRKAGDNTVFVAIRGSRVDAHRFIPDVARCGCRCIVAEETPEEGGYTLPEGVCAVRVKSSAVALAALSAARFGYPSERMTMVGITGTKGKTSSSYMMKTVLEECGHTVGVIGTNGCVIKDTHYDTVNTTPNSYELNFYFRKMYDAGCDTVVMECSSQGFKLDRTAGILFDYGIFLNLSPDHIGPLEHADFDEYLRCKSRLLAQCRTAIVNRDDEHTDRILNESGGGYGKLLTFSLNGDEEASIAACGLRFVANAEFAGTVFSVKGLTQGEFELSIPGRYNVSNCLAVLAAACDMGLDMSAVRRALKRIHVDGRMEAVYRSEKFTCIVDYAHNETSMVNLLETLRHYKPSRLVVVFGCGGNRAKDRRTGMARAAAKYADFSIFTSDNSRFERPEDIIDDIETAFLEAGGSLGSYIRITDRALAIRYAMEHARKGDMIAVIGKGHEAYQEENGVRRHFLDREEILKARDELGL